MAKKIVAMKVHESEKEELEQLAKASGRTVTDLLMEGLRSVKRMNYLETQNQDMQEQIRELTRRVERATGRKPRTTRRITIPVTEGEFRRINKLAFEAGLPKGQFMRGIMTGDRKLPALKSPV